MTVLSYNYEAIKQLAKREKCKVTDLIALAQQNDPFYVGTEEDTKKAEWFTELWHDFGFVTGVHLRRVHYKVVSQEQPIIMPNSLPYENTDKCWKYLGDASKYARYLGLIEPSAFVDRRNPTPHLNVFTSGLAPTIAIDSRWGEFDLSLPYFPDMPRYDVFGFLGEQKYHVEIWAEKTTQDDILLPLCRAYGVNLVTGAGELSITSTVDLLEKRMTTDKPLRILYVSDFDPAGLTMPVSISRKIEFFIRDRGITNDVQLNPVVLTPEQVRTYRLPRTPIKDTELRKGNFEDTYGAGATELDALEAIRPGELARIVTAEIRRFFDSTLSARVADAANELKEELAEIQEDVLDGYSNELDALRDEYEAVQREVKTKMAHIQQRLYEVRDAIENELGTRMPDLADYPIPKARDGKEYEEPLFDSGRDYLSQLRTYKDFQGKEWAEVSS